MLDFRLQFHLLLNSFVAVKRSKTLVVQLIYIPCAAHICSTRGMKDVRVT